MIEATDEALQRLYWACRKKSDFPGNIPDESNGFVTTAAVLDGLGINVRDLDDMGVPQEIKRPVHSFETDTQVRTQPQLQANASPVQVTATRQGRLTVEAPTDTFLTEYDQEYNSGSGTSFELATPIEMSIHEPLAMFVQPPTSAQHQALETFNLVPTPFITRATEPLFSVEDILDLSSCTAPVLPTTIHDFCETPQPYIHSKVDTNHLSHFQNDQSLSETMCDGFLSPWPGSLASALQSVSTV